MDKKNILNFLNKYNIPYNYEYDEEYDDEEPPIYIKRCAIHCGSYDYNEKPIPIKMEHKYYKTFGFLLNNENVIIIDCNECCGCGSW